MKSEFFYSVNSENFFVCFFFSILDYFFFQKRLTLYKRTNSTPTTTILPLTTKSNNQNNSVSERRRYVFVFCKVFSIVLFFCNLFVCLFSCLLKPFRALASVALEQRLKEKADESFSEEIAQH